MLSYKASSMDIFTKKDVAFLNLIAKKDVSIVCAKERGDWKGLKDILLKKPQEIIDIVKESGLRGRGGSWFFYRRKVVLY